ncbi:MAG: S24/S26 family peptidase [Chloroflexota bacterium]|nr:S24/S26 family peptidase [Chloroflexota bacterium]
MRASSGNDFPPLRDWLPLLQESLAQSGRFRWRLQGTSMMPTLPPGCEIEIVPAPKELRSGLLVVFSNGATLVAHRVVHRDGQYWITQGDGRWHPDLPLDADQVLGTVASAYQGEKRIWPRRFGRVTRWFWVARAHLLWTLRQAWRLTH